MSEALTLDEAAALPAEEFRTYHLADLLRRARARAHVPEHLAPGERGRTGLTQEQAAQLLGVDERNYREFEHGRILHPDYSLDQVAEVLGMSAVEQQALNHLAARHEPNPPPGREFDASNLRAVVDPLDIPALVTDRVHHYVAWNRAAAEGVLDPGALPEDERNAILLAFGPVGEFLFPTEENRFSAWVGVVRMAYLLDGGRDPALRELIARMLEYPQAAECWKAGVLDVIEPCRERVLYRAGPIRIKALRTKLSDDLQLSQFIPEQGGGYWNANGRHAVIRYAARSPETEPVVT